MYAQIGSIVFEGLNGFNSFNIDGDEANFAELELISGKPRLQKTGDSLQELSIEIKLHAKFCNPDEQLRALKKSKDAGEILPLLLGNGKYLGDYVIIGFPYTIDDAISDGTIIQATVSLSLKEYVSYNKLEQKQLAARKNAFALGDKRPVNLRNPQPESAISEISKSITDTKLQTSKVDNLVSEYQNNQSKRNILKKQITNACDKANSSIDNMNKKLADAQEIQNKFSGLKAAGASVVTAITALKALFPFDNLDSLQSANTYLQATARTFKRVSTPLFEDVITRKEK